MYSRDLSSSTQNLAMANGFFSEEHTPSERTITETEATDSYQNVLFSLLRFRTYIGSYPRKITIVTHEFKRERFMRYHLPAIGWMPIQEQEPMSSSSLDSRISARASLVGINPPPEITPPESLVEGELKRGIGLWARDRYGVEEELGEKRSKRGWKKPDGFIGKGLEPVVERLVLWDGGEGNRWFPEMGDLPWYYGREGSVVN